MPNQDEINISVPLSDSFISSYRTEYFNPNFQEDDVNNQILENVDLQRKIANDIVNSIRKEKPKELFKLLDPLYDEVENFDNSGLLQISISDKDDTYKQLLIDLENAIITDLQEKEEFRKAISKEIIDALF